MANSSPEIYSDLSYKPQLNQLGDATKLVNMDSIKQAIKTIVLTPLGSRLFEPTFGCGVGNYMFELLDEGTASKLQTLIKNAIASYEDRVVVDTVSVKIYPDTSEMDVEITYLIKELQEYDSTKISLSKL
jgi:phage baseplate assembly protein W